MEAIIPKEIRVPMIRTKIPEKANTEAITKDLDIAGKLLEVAAVCMISHQQRMTNLYNRHMKSCAFRVGDLVLRKVFENTVDPAASKFQPN